MKRLYLGFCLAILVLTFAAFQLWQYDRAVRALVAGLHYVTTRAKEEHDQLAAEREMRKFYQANISTSGEALIDAQARLSEALYRLSQMGGIEVP